MRLAVYITLAIIYFISLSGLFEKAGRKKWEAFVPGYNLYVWLKILSRPVWWMLLFIFPGVNILMLIILNVCTAIAYGKRKFTEHLIMIFLPFIMLPQMAFDKSLQFVGRPDPKTLKKSALREWGDAALFAIIAASIIRTYFLEAFTIPTSSMEKTLLKGDFLFVSKINYGPKIPNTPLSFPFAHHSFPDWFPIIKGKKSYTEIIKLPYYRLPGFEEIERNDIVVFNFPEGDTVIVQDQNRSYHQIVREYATQLKYNDNASKTDEEYMKLARKIIANRFDITVRPLDDV
jgi:signal peptidase I